MRVENGVLTEVWPEADEIVLPEIVREIPEKAFAARRIKSIKLNEGLRTIGEMAFCGASVPEIILPASLEQLGDHAFYHCAGLTRVDMSRTQLAALPKNLFAYADIEQIVWPARLAEIGTQAFLGTGRLKRVEIPETVRKIGFEAFRESAVESVVLPDGVTEIAGRAFYLCASLVEVSVHGASGDTADGALRGACFVGCPSLERLAIRGASGLWSRDCCPAIPGYRRSSFRQASGRLLSGRSTTRESVRSAWRPRHRPLPG